MTKGRRTVFFIARAGVVAGLYAALTILLAPISYGPVQLRVSEAMTILPLFFPEAVVGLIVGCLLANLFTGVWFDIVFGTLATAIAAVITLLIGQIVKKKWMPFVASIPPVLINAIVLPLTWLLFSSDAAYFLNFATVFAGQTAAVYALGLPLYYGLRRAKIQNGGIRSH